MYLLLVEAKEYSSCTVAIIVPETVGQRNASMKHKLPTETCTSLKLFKKATAMKEPL